LQHYKIINLHYFVDSGTLVVTQVNKTSTQLIPVNLLYG